MYYSNIPNDESIRDNFKNYINCPLIKNDFYNLMIEMGIGLVYKDSKQEIKFFNREKRLDHINEILLHGETWEDVEREIHVKKDYREYRLVRIGGWFSWKSYDDKEVGDMMFSSESDENLLQFFLMI